MSLIRKCYIHWEIRTWSRWSSLCSRIQAIKVKRKKIRTNSQPKWSEDSLYSNSPLVWSVQKLHRLGGSVVLLMSDYRMHQEGLVETIFHVEQFSAGICRHWMELWLPVRNLRLLKVYTKTTILSLDCSEIQMFERGIVSAVAIQSTVPVGHPTYSVNYNLKFKFVIGFYKI